MSKKLLLVKKNNKLKNNTLIPKELYNEYTLNGKIDVRYRILDGTNDLHEKNWTKEYLNSYIERFTIDNILNNKHGKEPYYKASLLICNALKEYELKNKKIAVIGSTSPWIEAIILNHGCDNITTVEYNKPTSFHPNIKTIEYTEYMNQENFYDYVITYSSIEHSGLGRYGDPLNPNGDIESMGVINKSLKNNGIIFWGAPVGGRDVLTWNAHRVYGKIRLPLLFKNFKIIKWHGLDESALKINKIYPSGIRQPVIVAKKEIKD